MQPEVVAAIITGGVAVLAPIITLVFKQIYDRRSLGNIKGRRKAVIGTWSGSIVQEIDSNVVSFNLEITFSAGKKIVQGDASFISPTNNQLTKLKFIGGFLHERFIKFEYKNPDESIIQFGSSILDLSSDGKTLNGKFIGYGSATNRIVNGEVMLKRVV